jgi:hypothetical protein
MVDEANQRIYARAYELLLANDLPRNSTRLPVTPARSTIWPLNRPTGESRKNFTENYRRI